MADRQATWNALLELARTGPCCTFAAALLAFTRALGGWRRLTRRGVANVYETLSAEKRTLWAVKYKSRDGWAQADPLRLAHPKTADPIRNAALKFMVSGELKVDGDTAPVLRVAEVYQAATQTGGLTWLLRNPGTLSRVRVPTWGADRQ